MRTLTYVARVLAVALPAWAGAQQDVAAIAAGERVRLRARSAEASGRVIRCEARVAELSADTLVLSNPSRWGGCPRAAYPTTAISSVEVARGSRGSRLVHAGIGLAVGAAAVGGIGWLAAGDGCRSGFDGCDDGDIVAVFLAFGGAVVGGATGAIVGALLPAGPRWVSVPATGPVRVAGIALRPGVRWEGGR